MTEHFDVVIVGAGISGIGAAYHLGARCPGRTYVILEGRADLGGTWDLFKYPGIRSDSDMFTLGYSFKPWTDAKAIADGPSIMRYLRETATEHGIDQHIRFGHEVGGAAWSSEDALWTVEAKCDGEAKRFTCNFLFMCTGYYDYEEGYTPELPGTERFQGRIVHPQKWTEDIEYAGRRVVVIGSGATAVTLVPELAKKAAHVTMLQRSPTYVFSAPAEDAIANKLRDTLPAGLAHSLTRWKNVALGMAFFNLSRRAPKRVKKLLVGAVRKRLDPDYDVERHFAPSYDPWDQRVCLVPDGDLFDVIRSGRASVVTDQIETFTEEGISLRSGEQLEADLIITATGLVLRLFGGVDLVVDGKPVVPSETMSYKAMMFSDVPNLALSFGYTNASWTLKADLTSEYVCRLLNLMEREGYRRCVPRQRDPSISEIPFLDFTSGYVTRALPLLPKQGSRAPWRLYQNYLLDILTLRHGPIEDSAMELS